MVYYWWIQFDACIIMYHSIPTSKDEFYMQAIRAYDPSCISMKEFKKDIRIIKKINRELKRWSEGEEINLRSLLNAFLIVFNQFGEYSSSLIFYQMTDDIVELACHFIVRLGRRDNLVDSRQVNINEKLLEELLKI